MQLLSPHSGNVLEITSMFAARTDHVICKKYVYLPHWCKTQNCLQLSIWIMIRFEFQVRLMLPLLLVLESVETNKDGICRGDWSAGSLCQNNHRRVGSLTARLHDCIKCWASEEIRKMAQHAWASFELALSSRQAHVSGQRTKNVEWVNMNKQSRRDSANLLEMTGAMCPGLCQRIVHMCHEWEEHCQLHACIDQYFVTISTLSQCWCKPCIIYAQHIWCPVVAHAYTGQCFLHFNHFLQSLTHSQKSYMSMKQCMVWPDVRMMQAECSSRTFSKLWTCSKLVIAYMWSPWNEHITHRFQGMLVSASTSSAVCVRCG